MSEDPYTMSKDEKAREICSILGVRTDINNIGRHGSGFTSTGLSRVLRKLRDLDSLTEGDE